MSGILIKAQVELDFNVNNEIKTSINLSKKLGDEPDTKERVLGEMIERQHKIEKVLTKKGMSFDDLLTLLKSK